MLPVNIQLTITTTKELFNKETGQYSLASRDKTVSEHQSRDDPDTGLANKDFKAAIITNLNGTEENVFVKNVLKTKSRQRYKNCYKKKKKDLGGNFRIENNFIYENKNAEKKITWWHNRT